MKGLVSFYEVITSLRELKDSGDISISDLTVKLIEKTGYLSIFDSLDPIESENKTLNIQELVSSIKHFEEVNSEGTLTEYLDNVSLVSSGDVKGDGNCVSLMTIHSAKGLEFDYVFLTGFENGLLPHVNSKNSEAEVEEERRLCYVAITRAKKKLYITFSEKRSRGRMSQYNMPSPFLKDIPGELLEPFEPYKDRNIYSEQYENKNITVKVHTDISRSSRKFNESGIKAGMIVKHGKFGIGKILALTGAEEEEKVVIFFKRYGKKTLLVKKAKLQIL